ncbi:MAG TPA: permease-like cell division protein FtsX [Acidimicrobiales bacterium]|nr:permease-like cell division protein FtsX [Acidimicrobiales bacterium]
MAANVDYVARETASNLWRNRLMTIAAVLTVAVSLSLVGAAMLLRQGIAHATTQWQHGVNVDVFLDPGIPPAQEKAINQQLVQLPYVRSCTYRSQRYDYAEAKHLLPSDESQVLTAATVPSSLRCALDNPGHAPDVFAQFSGKPGVDQVAYPSQALRNMEQVTNILQWVFLIVAVILLLSASVLILNTIRLAIFARRREVSVMKLVGATNWFIRVPFMCEGLVQGVVGAVVAALAVLGLHLVLNALGNSTTGNVFTQMRMPGGEVLVTNIVVVLIGLVVGTLGSAFAIRRFLDA